MKVYIPMVKSWVDQEFNESYLEETMFENKAFNSYEKAYTYLLNEINNYKYKRYIENINYKGIEYIFTTGVNMEQYVKSKDVSELWGDSIGEWHYVLELEVE